MRDRLLAALEARIAKTIDTGDPRLVLAPEAVTEAEALLARVLPPAADPEDPPDVEALHAVGWLFWLRAHALPSDEFDDELQMAALVLRPVYALDPEAVPEPLLAFYAEQPAPPSGGPHQEPDDADPAAHTNQGVQLFEWYEQTGDLDALQRAISAFRAAVDTVPEQHPNRGMCLFNLHEALSALGERTGDVAALREAVSSGRAGLEITDDDDPERAGRIAGVGTALRLLYQHTGDENTLREAVRLAKAAVDATSDGDPGRAGRLSNLGIALETLFDHTGDAEVLDEAVAAGRAAVAAIPADDPSRAAGLSNLANTLRTWFNETGDLATLREAVAVGRDAVAATPDGDPGLGLHLATLGGALSVWYEHTGDLEPLRESVTTGRAAAAATPAGHPDHPRLLANLGVALRLLFEHTGDLDTLREAVAAHRDAVAATPDGHSRQDSRLTNLGNTLRAWYDRTGDLDTLRDAVVAGRAAVAATPDGHPRRAANLSNLGAGLYALFLRTEDLDPLREAALALTAAATATPEGHPLHARHQFNLGVSLHALFLRTGKVDTLRAAVASGRAAVAATEDGHPELAGYLSALGMALHSEFKRTGDRPALRQASAALARAAVLPTAAVTERIHAGQWQARVAALGGDQPGALAAMEAVVSLLPQVASRELRRADREHRLGEVAGIGAQAAAAALSAGRPVRAVELLERARGLLLAETMDARSDQARLQAQAPDLADEFSQIRDHLTGLAAAPSPGTGTMIADPPDPDRAHRLADQRRQAAAEWDALLKRIHARPGLADFLAPPPIDRLRPQAEAGPIVIVNTTDDRCDALILTADPDHPVRHLSLTNLTQESAYKQGDRFLAARRAATTGVSLAERRDAQAVLHQVLGWLWDTVTEPILTSLGYTGPPEPGQPWPRLWWCPVGGMAFLPLHAAGHHRDVDGGSAQPRTVLDRVVSSYTATIRALAYARQALTHLDPDAPRGPGLIVSMPDTPGAASLPGVADESRELAGLLPGATVMSGHQATHDAVVAALPAHAVAHFACHGISEWTAPDTSRLLLHDHPSHPLTATAVSRLHLTGAELAYLSACSTTDTRPNLADEAVHITAAFQLAGYRHVIGTLWPIVDHAATRLAVDVYTHLTGDGTHPPHTDQSALALHHAVRRLRTDHLASPTVWAAHIHTGR